MRRRIIRSQPLPRSATPSPHGPKRPTWYFSALRTTIDAAGRVVIPKSVRDQLGLRGGASVEIALRDEQIVIEPASVPMRFDPEAGCIVAETDSAMPPLATDEVRAVMERVRR